jgi:hypothetical protein
MSSRNRNWTLPVTCAQTLGLNFGEPQREERGKEHSSRMVGHPDADAHFESRRIEAILLQQ